jgi:hypothetical protein
MQTIEQSYSERVSNLITIAEQHTGNRGNRVLRHAALTELQTVGLSDCFWSDEHCDCRDVATVHDIESESEFCSRHYAALLKARR